MKVRMLTNLAGPKFSCPPGNVVDVPNKMGGDLIKGGFAEKVDEVEKRNARRAASKAEKAAAAQAWRPAANDGTAGCQTPWRRRRSAGQAGCPSASGTVRSSSCSIRHAGRRPTPSTGGVRGG